ncbi:MAG: DeoR/GlpR family DNA-binding transcription regulator [Alkalispirochaeta sp.]
MVVARKERLSRLLNKVRVEQHTTIDDLADFFHVSTVTIRRDIKELEKQELIVQTVGGGVIYKTEHTGAVDPHSPSHAINEKIRIAEYCTELVRNHDDILIGPGTTTFLVGKILSGITDRNFRIITNSLELAMETGSAPNIRTVVLGGEVRNKYAVGYNGGVEYFTKCHRHHTLLLSADGVDLEAGITIFETHLIPIVLAMRSVSDRVILTVDSSKCGVARYNNVARFEDIDIVVTDVDIPGEYRERIEAAGARLVTV